MSGNLRLVGLINAIIISLSLVLGFVTLRLCFFCIDQKRIYRRGLIEDMINYSSTAAFVSTKCWEPYLSDTVNNFSTSLINKSVSATVFMNTHTPMG